jgi:hypothetical protein
MLWLTAFAWTIAFELPVYVALTKFRAWWMPVVFAFAVNALTHPLLWFVVPRVGPFWLFVLYGEAGVIAVEALALAAVGQRRPLLIATIANLTSAVLGGFAFELFI